jgi:integrase/recombinase XerD
VKSLRVEVAAALAYWTVVNDDYEVVPAADAFLRHLRFGAGRAEGTTKAYAGDVALFLSWCERTGRDLTEGTRALGLFVAMLKTTPVERVGAGQGRVRSANRVNHVLAAIRELTKHAVATGDVDASVLAVLYEVGDDRHLPSELRPQGSGLRYVARPRHRQRSVRPKRPEAVHQHETEALLRVCRSWRDKFLIVLLWFCGLRIGETLGLRRCDMHLSSSSEALGCGIRGPHLHVVSRENANGASAKSGDRHVPVPTDVLACYDRYLTERETCKQAEACDFVLVNLFHEPLGGPMSDHTVRQWLAASSWRSGLARTITPHMFRHATAAELLERGAGVDVVKELLGHASIRSTEPYLHATPDAMRRAVDRLGPLSFGPESMEET